MDAYVISTQVRKIIIITIAWTLIAIFQYFMVYANLIQYECNNPDLDVWIHFKGSILTGVIAGIIGGSTLVFVWERWLRTKPYGWTLRSLFLSYVVVFYLVAIPTTVFFRLSELNLSILDVELWVKSFEMLTHPTMLAPFFTWMVIVVLTMIAFLVNDKYGPGVFKDFLLGKYFQPKREERIFMFMDLRSSTAIAEEIGEARYFNFLRDVFEYATPSVLQNKGEIYQYVGDEMVVTWPIEKGVVDANCIKCFFDIQESLNKYKDYFKKEYGRIPEFKAGLHYGHVMTGEIGVVKRDIAFSGDVLNTTSRIQEMCNEYGVNILISKYLMDRINNFIKGFNIREIGEVALKGKQQSVVLFTV